jgi:hypothetical protein
LIFNTLGLVVLVITLPIWALLDPAGARGKASALPPEIVGHWQSVSPSTSGLAMADYNFTAQGYYSFVSATVVQEGACRVRRTRSGWGRVRIEGPRMTLAPAAAKSGMDNPCTGQRSEAPVATAEETYFYRLDRQPAGWSLCLEGREGTRCLSPAKPLQGG